MKATIQLITFQSTLPAWGATISGPSQAIIFCCFNPRSPRGERRGHFAKRFSLGRFQSTLPAWGATEVWLPTWSCSAVSIHAPRVGSDFWHSAMIVGKLGFQSTLPAWGATEETAEGVKVTKFQSTLPAWGATPGQQRTAAGSVFQSTLPAWGATRRLFSCTRSVFCFNPRSPRGERPECVAPNWCGKEFQSTLPAWGATIMPSTVVDQEIVSIHAPRVGSDERSASEELPQPVSIHAPRVGSDGLFN